MESLVIDPIDTALQAATPTVMVPRYSPFAPLEEPGHRFLVASDGLWVEIKRAWLRAVLPVAMQQVVAMPYGWLKQIVEIQCGQIPGAMLQAFVTDGESSSDTEIAGAVIWDEQTRGWRYERLLATEASGDHIRYLRPQLAVGEHLVLDMHSHGRHPAYFSPEDDRDDRGEVKLALVVGRSPASGLLEMCSRLCALGIHLPISPDDFVGSLEATHG